MDNDSDDFESADDVSNNDSPDSNGSLSSEPSDSD